MLNANTLIASSNDAGLITTMQKTSALAQCNGTLLVSTMRHALRFAAIPAYSGV